MTAIKVEGGRELRKALKDLEGKDGPKRLKGAYKEIADMAASDAKSAASGGTPLQRKMAGAIKARATTTRGSVAFTRTKNSHPATGPAFWGVKDRRLGWFADPKYAGYTARTQKLPVHVGNTWTAATRGQGPHRVNDALAANVDRYVDAIDDAMDKAIRDAGF